MSECIGESAALLFEEALPGEEESLRRRRDALVAGLDGTHRTALRVATDFFSFVQDLNRQLWLSTHATDDDRRCEAVRYALELATTALAALRLFGRLLGCGDLAEAGDRLDRLVAYGRSKGWRLDPPWWSKVPSKNTAYFVGQLKVFAGKRDALLHEARLGAEAKRRKPPEEDEATALADGEGGAA